MADEASQKKRKICPWTVTAYLLPPGLVLGLFVVYLISPKFYLQYILEERNREEQVVEYITVLSAFIGSLALFYSSARLWVLSSSQSLADPLAENASDPPSGFLLRRGAALMVLVVGLASFFLAGEEIDWGTTWFPELYPTKERTNFHNRDALISANVLGGIFLISYFFVLPWFWHRRRLVKLPMNWTPAIPDGPVIAAVAQAYVFKGLIKNIGRKVLVPDEATGQPVIYWQYMDQFNEQKEMLIAVALLIFGVGRVLMVQKLAKQKSAGDADAP